LARPRRILEEGAREEKEVKKRRGSRKEGDGEEYRRGKSNG
jgi:hypothetical protein